MFTPVDNRIAPTGTPVAFVVVENRTIAKHVPQSSAGAANIVATIVWIARDAAAAKPAAVVTRATR
jgi:hypothetical protein